MSSTLAAPSQHTRGTAASPIRTTACRRNGRGRTRGLSVLEVVVLIAIVVALVSGVMMTASHSVPSASREQIQVEAGETLWSIARAHPVQGQTTAQTADTIAALNGLDSAHVAVGQSLSVPADERDVRLASR